jgi:hypothetical protein
MEKEKRVLKCVSNDSVENRLTIGRYYPIEYNYVDHLGKTIYYYMLDDCGTYSTYHPKYFVEGAPRSLSTKDCITDPIVEQVKELFDKRSQAGIKKYGTTLYDNNKDNFFDHLQQELMDGILYLQKLIKNEEEKQKELDDKIISSAKYNPAVNYLIDQYENEDLSNDFDRYLAKEKAIRLFKEQILYAFVSGKYSSKEYKDGKDFYNENFK